MRIDGRYESEGQSQEDVLGGRHVAVRLRLRS